jgi:hypothetical protein
MYHPKMNEFLARFKAMFDQIDGELEDRHGKLYSLHPSRPEQGSTSNPQADGLFTIGADFTPGYGSDLGRGYVLDIYMATLERVSPTDRERIMAEVVNRVRDLLPTFFPERNLEIRADGSGFKIVGDFSLGSV